MKVKCKDVRRNVGLLTEGKEYEVVSLSDRFYSIVNDKGIVSRYCKDCFVEIKEIEPGYTFVDFVDEVKEDIIRESFNFASEDPKPINVRKLGKYEESAIEIGKLVDKKSSQYGDTITNTGDVLKLLYPNGITAEQYNDLGIIVRVWDKLKRIAKGNQGEENAYKDICGYSLLMCTEE